MVVQLGERACQVCQSVLRFRLNGNAGAKEQPRQHDAHRLSHAWIFFDNDTCVLIVVVPGSGIGKKIIQDRNAIVAGLPELGTNVKEESPPRGLGRHRAP